MAEKEAKARIKINKLLEEAGWRFFDDKNGKANIRLENAVQLTPVLLEGYGEDFEKVGKGYIDYLLTDDKGKAMVVLEAKRESTDPLTAKEQARRYAQIQDCRFIILSNGNLHYFWDLKRGNPQVITHFPKPDAIEGFKNFTPNRNDLIRVKVESDYIVLTQNEDYAKKPQYINSQTRKAFIDENKLKFLRPYQLRAIRRIQEEVKAGKDRFLIEMATGTGKTLTAAAIIKLFLKSANARRILFLVDRLELEKQAAKAFDKNLEDYCKTCIYKDNPENWKDCAIVVSTVQSLLYKNKYKRIFSPSDFDLVISDEAHRSVGGKSRAVFEYFMGYKLGLTATPKDYLRRVDTEQLQRNDPRALEKRMILDTYITFGCQDGNPTFQYSLTDGAKDGYLVMPTVADARSEITTQLLSDKGYSVMSFDDEEETEIEADTVQKKEPEELHFTHKDFERNFFSDETNELFCRTFLENALRDPVTGEIGKTIIFCVSQKHAGKITQTLNLLADAVFPDKYQSDFAVQVTSLVQDAQDMTIRFANNNLNGKGNFNPLYQTAKTRVCVTVGMMTTGYDCPDLLNICLMRPIFSPTDFVQIKGRGTRKWSFTNKEVLKDPSLTEFIPEEKLQKTRFKLFDFFANCEFFEEKFNYDEVLKLPVTPKGKNEFLPTDQNLTDPGGEYISYVSDPLKSLTFTDITVEGMRIDRRFFERFENQVKEDDEIKQLADENNWEQIEQYIIQNIFDRPQDFINLEKLRKALNLDRRLSVRELVEKIFGKIAYFKSKNELLEDEFEKFDSRILPGDENFELAKHVFKAYITDENFRSIVNNKQFALLGSHPNGKEFLSLPPDLKKKIPEYIKDYVILNRFLT